MTDLPLLIEKIAGSPTDNAETGILTKKISLPDGSGGTLVCCILAQGDKELITAVVRDVFDLATGKIETIEGEILDNLKSIAQAAEDYVSNKEISLSFVFGFFYKDVGYIVRMGGRVKVFVFEGERSGELSFDAGSGPIGSGQVYLIATDSFLEGFDRNILKDPNLDLSEVIDGFATEVSARENQSEMGAVFVTVGEAKEEEEQEGVTGSEVGQNDQEVILEETQEEVVEERENVVGEEAVLESAAEEEAQEGEGEETLEEAVKTSEEQSGEGVAVGYAGVENKDEENMEPAAMDEAAVDMTPNEEVFAQSESAAFAVELPEPQKPIFSKVIGAFGLVLKRGLRELKRLKRGDVRALMRLRRNIFLVALIVILVLVGSGGWAIFSKNQKAKTAEFQKHLDAATAKYNEGSSIVELNKQRAREILADAQKEVDLAKALGIKSDKADTLASEIASKIKQTDVSSGVTLTNFAETSEDLNSISYWNKNLVAFGSDKIYVFGPDGKAGSEIKGESISEGFVFDNKAFVVSGSGVERVDLASESRKTIVDGASGQDIGVFFGNVYLLGKSQIDKIVPIEGGYSAPKDYLSSPVAFSNESKFAIDSLIWATNGKKILKFNRGNNESFDISGLAGELGNLGPIYTDSNIDNLYVIDKANGALLIVDKNGNYKKSLQSPEFTKATDLLVSPSEDKVYVSVGSRVLETSLK